jgi:hypothetical protein
MSMKKGKPIDDLGVPRAAFDTKEGVRIFALCCREQPCRSDSTRQQPSIRIASERGQRVRDARTNLSVVPGRFH